MAEVSLKQSSITGTAGAGRGLAGWKQAAVIVGATVLVALCAHVSIPLGFTPVPLTLQPFAVLLLGLLLAPRTALAALVLYLVEGASGLPVFSPHGAGGVTQLFGPTGGYLLAAPIAAALAGLLYRAGRRSFAAGLAAAAAGDLVLLGLGAAWLGLLEHARLSLLFDQAVLPFLGSDAIKVLAAACCAYAFGRFGERGPVNSRP